MKLADVHPLSAAAAATAVAEGSTVSVSKPQQPLPSLQNHGIEETIFPKLTGSMQQRLSVHFADDNIPIMNSVVVHSGGSSSSSSSRFPILSTISSHISKRSNEGIHNNLYDCYLIAALQVNNNNYITLLIHYFVEWILSVKLIEIIL